MKLRSGREIREDGLSIGGRGQLRYGCDGDASVITADGFGENDPLNADERMEIALAMILEWTEWASPRADE